jgi:hypothetical protein
VNTQKGLRCYDEALFYFRETGFSYFRGMRSVLALLIFLSLVVSCTETECIDCTDTQGNVFTFCDPADPPFDTLNCGEIYTSVK